MRVIAVSLGYYKGSRRRVGVEFDMAEKDMKQRDGNPVLPAWVLEATPENRGKLGTAAEEGRKKGLEAVAAAAGPKRHARQLPKEEGSDLV